MNQSPSSPLSPPRIPPRSWGRTICYALLLAGTLVYAGCYRSDVRNLRVEIPQLQTRQAGEFLCSQLRRFNNSRYTIYLDLQVDLPQRVLHVTYNALKISDLNVIHHIADMGFDVEGIPGNPEVRSKWPPEWTSPPETPPATDR